MPGDLEKKLRELDNQRDNYPPELKSATRAEFKTLVRTTKKKGPGCPIFGSIFILVIGLIAYIF